MNATGQHSEHRNEISVDQEETRERLVNVWRDTVDDASIFNEFPPRSGEVVAQLVVAGCKVEQAALSHMSGASWPIMWIHGDAYERTHVHGTQALIIDGRPVSRVKLAGRVVGSHWSDEDADYCLLAGILPTNSRETRGSQTVSCMQQIEIALGDVGMDFSHIIRTWFYLDDLLAWYGEFNAARTEFFEGRGVFDRLVPASTGIGASNPAGTALVAGALAIRSRHERVHVEEVVSPLQCSATEYRSSFSRAVEVTLPSRRLLIISGTASIAADGKSMFANDVVKQIHRTLDVVGAILQSRQMNWHNTTRAIAYFRDIEELPAFEACCRERGIPQLPILPVHSTICRDDLLFEIEVDATASLLDKALCLGTGTL
jgi:enamine deaminase RidA (YjgF/YER057c/UK114 family)